ncbi:hypothetical protein FAZ95_10610 [Trinickia violacea]|uniref:Uncharacterized protein n=1 Tax=Trinickia violacea TaxID=2571746 RepID=A0A4P8IR15_9BURK|nr:hypothetical protein FAZ95_10610 [Trinickia violacea]
MHALADLVVSFAPPPLMVTVVFSVAYLLVGIPFHFRSGAVARNVYGTLAGVFLGIGYITFVVGFSSGLHAAPR